MPGAHVKRGLQSRSGEEVADVDCPVYRGSTALILRSRGQLSGCSAPLGRRGVFWDRNRGAAKVSEIGVRVVG